MKVIFARRKTVGSALIRWFTWSQWSHVGVVIDNDFIIDTTLKHGGVRVHAGRKWIDEYPDHQVIDVAVPDERAAIAFLRRQLFKPYDWTGLVGIALRSRRWAEADRWFCSELVAAALVEGGGLRNLRLEAQRITPRDLWAVI